MLMVTVIERGCPIERVVCRYCRSVLHYEPKDVQQMEWRDEFNRLVTAKWIGCPVCLQKVAVS